MWPDRRSEGIASVIVEMVGQDRDRLAEVLSHLGGQFKRSREAAEVCQSLVELPPALPQIVGGVGWVEQARRL